LPFLKKIAVITLSHFGGAQHIRMIYIRYFRVTESDSSGCLAGTKIGSQPVAADCDLGNHTHHPNWADANLADVLVSAKTRSVP
jgi:hypothetical protein